MLISPLGLMDASARSLSVDSLEDEVFYSEDLGGTFVRSIKGTVVIVEWIPNDSAVDRFILVNQNGVITLNGDNFITLDTLDISNMEYPKSGFLQTASDIKWGSWHEFSEQVNTGGYSTAIAAGLVAAAAPWVSVRLIATLISGMASASEYYTISGKLRYGEDDTSFHWERYTSIQNDKDEYLIRDHFDAGEEPLF